MPARMLLGLTLLLMLPATAAGRWSTPREVGPKGAWPRDLQVTDAGQVRLLLGADDGRLWAARGPLGSTLPRRQLLSRAAVDPTIRALPDGRTVVLWRERLGPNTIVPVAVTARPRGRFRAPFAVGPVGAEEPHHAVGSSGLGLSFYRSTAGMLEVVRWRLDGRVSRPQALAYADDYRWKQIGIGGRRHAVAMWCGGRTGSQVRYATGRADRPLAVPRSIPGASCGSWLRVAVADGGRAVAAWKDLVGRPAASYRRRDGSFGPPTILRDEATGPPMVASFERYLAVAWSNSLVGDRLLASVDGGPTESLAACPGVWLEGFDPQGRLMMMDTTAKRSVLCTRLARGRFRRERLPLSFMPTYAASRAGRAVLGITYSWDRGVRTVISTSRANGR